jgi:hypothetical protein
MIIRKRLEEKGKDTLGEDQFRFRRESKLEVTAGC